MNTMATTKKLFRLVSLLLIATYASYLFHGFMFRDIAINLAVCLYATWKPNTFCVIPQNDEYNFIAGLPIYILMALIPCIGYITCNHINMISMSWPVIGQLTLLAFLVFMIIDISRYSD